MVTAAAPSGGRVVHPRLVLLASSAPRARSRSPLTSAFLPAISLVLALSCLLPTAAFAQYTFGPRTEYPTGVNPRGAAIADFNEDGRPDLIVANRGSGSVTVFLATGPGTYGSGTPISIGGTPQAVSVADLNGDGHQDFAVVASSVSVYHGNGQGAFSHALTHPTGTAPYSIAIGDVSGDGRPDMVIACQGSNAVAVHPALASGGFGTRVLFGTGASPYSVALADVTGDGILDAVTANYGSGTVSLLRGLSNGSFATRVDYAAGTSPIWVAAGDLNADGRADVVASNYGSASVSVLYSQAGGTLGGRQDLATSGSPYGVTITDVDRDGLPDIAVAQYSSSTVGLWRAAAGGGFAARADLAAGTGAVMVAAADLNADLYPDLVVPSYTGNTVSVFLQSGPGPRITVLPAALAFGSGGHLRPDTLSLEVRNDGDGLLSVNYLSTTGDFALADGSPFTLSPGASRTLAVIYRRSAIGDATGTLALLNNDPARPNLQVPLSGSAVGPALSVSPPFLDFGAGLVGAPQTLSVLVQNLGNATLQVSSVTSSDAEFRVVPAGPFSVAPNNWTYLSVEYRRTVPGARSSTVTISSDDAARPVLGIPVQGSAIAPVPVLTWSPGTLDFGADAVGVTSTLSLTLGNTGNAPLTISSLAIDGSEFVLAESGPLVIPAGSQRALDVHYPRATAGTVIRTLTVTSDDPQRPVVAVPMSGTAVEPGRIAVAPDSLVLAATSSASDTTHLTLSNTGLGPLSFTIGSGPAAIPRSVPIESLSESILSNDEPRADAPRPEAAPYQPDLLSTGLASGGAVLVIGDGATEGDVVPILQAAGYSTTLVADDAYYTGANPPPSSFGAVILLDGRDYSDDMLQAGQQALVDYVAGGGTLIVSEWIAYEVASGRYSTLAPLMPVTRSGGSSGTFPFSVVQSHPITAGVAATFWVETAISHCAARPGASVLVTSSGPVVSLRAHGSGNVVHFAVAGNYSTYTPFRHAEIQRLLLNAVAWGVGGGWLSWSPSSGTIAPGSSAQVEVAAAGTNVAPGVYRASLSVGSSDPARPIVSVPVRFDHATVPELTVTPASIAFGDGFVGEPDSSAVQVGNAGAAPLTVNSTTLDSPEFEVLGGAPFLLEGGETRTLTVRYLRRQPGTVAAALAIASDDPVRPWVAVPLSGNALPAPRIAVSPDSLAFTLASGDSSRAELLIANHGQLPLAYSIGRVAVLAQPLRALRVLTRAPGDDVPTAKGEPDRYRGATPLRAGGPDAFGYVYADSDEPGGPTFAWVDIRGNGTYVSVSGDDATYGPFPIGFTFPFYGSQYATFNLSTNGFLSFTSMAANLGNVALPSPLAPGNMIAAFWDDLLAYGAWYHFDGQRLIVQSAVQGHYGAYGSYEFQYLLYPTGDIVIQYRSMSGLLNSATVGIQNSDGTDGLTVVHNADYARSGLTLRFSPTGWISVVPDSGTVMPGEADMVGVTVDARSLSDGTYRATLDVRSNDPVAPSRVVPLAARVVGTPAIALAPDSLAFPARFVGLRDSLRLTIRNVGSAALGVSDVASSDPEFQPAFAGPMTIGAGGQRDVWIRYLRSAAGVAAGEIRVASNDPAAPEVSVLVRGTSLERPVAFVRTDTLRFVVESGASDSGTIVVRNDGLGPLEVSAGPEVGWWMWLIPDVFTVAPGDSATLGVRVDAQGLDAGTYHDAAGIVTNDPGRGWIRVPVRMDVWGLPQIAVAPDSLDFGEVFLGQQGSRALTIRNDGHAALNVTGMTVEGGGFGLSGPTAFTLAPAAAAQVTVTFQPPSEGASAGVLRVASDDPANPLAAVPLAGIGRLAPAITVEPDSFRFELVAGDSASGALRVRNSGPGLLHFRVRAAASLQGALAALEAAPLSPPAVGDARSHSAHQAPEGFASMSAATPRPDDSFEGPAVLILEDTAPWNTSVNEQLLGAAGVPFDVRSSGDLPSLNLRAYDLIIVASDQGQYFYDRVAANLGVIVDFVREGGVLDFRAAGWGWNAGGPEGLTLPGGATIHHDGYQWNNVVWLPQHPLVAGLAGVLYGNPASHAHFSPTPAYASLVLGDELGRATLIEYRYGAGTVLATTVSIEFQYAYGYPVGAILPRLIARGLDLASVSWLSANPDSGVVSPGSVATLDAWAKATRLNAGQHRADLVVTHDDPSRGDVRVPVSLVVTGAPAVALAPDTLAFGRGFVGTPSDLGLRVSNVGRDSLHVSGVESDHPEFIVLGPSAFVLPPGGLQDVPVRYLRGAVGLHAGNVTVRSDDPARPEVASVLSGESIHAPVARLVPDSLHFTAPSGSAVAGTLLVANDGLGELVWSLSVPASPPWLSLSATSGATAPGDSTPVEITADATPLFAGLYGAVIRAATSDPSRPLVDVPVRFAVSGTPRAAVDRDTVRFDSTWVGIPSQRTLRVRNDGTDSLRLTYVAVTNGRFALLAAPPPALGPGQHADLGLRFSPVTDGSEVGELEIGTNDPDRPRLLVRLEGIGRHPAVATLSPDRLDLVVEQDAVITSGITLGNAGLGPMQYAFSGLPPWVTLQPLAGSLPPQSGVAVSVRVDATGIAAGDYAWTLHLDSSDPVRARVDLPVTVRVTGVPPAAVAYESPLDGQVNLPQRPTLRWKPSARAQSYDLFVWPDGQGEPADPLVSGLTALSHALEPPLPTGSVHRWKVVARNPAGTTAGAVRSFTTERLPDLVTSLVEVPPAAFSGQPFTVRRVVTNFGDNGTNAPEWRDAVWLSPTAVFEPATAVLLGRPLNPTYLAPGESYAEAQSYTLPRGIAGTYWVFVQADHDNAVREGREDNNAAANTQDLAVQLTPPPDLVVDNLTASRDGQSGQDIFVRWTVRNVGTGETRVAAWSDAVYLSQDAALNPATDLLLGGFAHSGALDAAESYASDVQVRLPQKISGTWHVFVCADAWNGVYEHTHEQNNCDAPPAAVNVVLTPAPDLIVSDIRPQASALAGQAFEIEWTVRNQGAGEPFEPTWNDRVYLSPTETFDPDRSLAWTVQRSGPLAAGATDTQRRSFTLPVDLAGTRYVFVEADYGDAVFENGEDANNRSLATAAVDVQLSPAADLVVAQIGCPAVAAAGDAVTVTWGVQNAGPGRTQAEYWTDRVSIVSGDAWDPARVLASADVVRPTALNGFSTYGASARLSLPPTYSGPARAFVETDATSRVFEHQAEDNNRASGERIEIGPMAPSRLAVTDVVAPAEAVVGHSFTVRWTVTNHGPRATWPDSWTDEVYFSDDDILLPEQDRLVATSQRRSSLAAGDSYVGSVTFTVPGAPEGDVHVFVVTDRAGRVLDDQPADNAARAPAVTHVYLTPPNLPPPPDLRVAAMGAPAEVTAGQPATVSWTVSNEGPGSTAERWYDAVYLSTDPLPGGDLQVASVPRSGALASGQEYSTSAEFVAPAYLSGDYYVLVLADSRNEVDERGEEADNHASSVMRILVPPPADLVVAEVLAPPAAVPGTPVTVTWTLRNVGLYRAAGRIRDGVYLSSDPAWDIDDAVVAFKEHDIDLAPGQQARLSATVDVAEAQRATADGSVTSPLPGVTPGPYRMLVRTDVRNVIRESDDGNNLGMAASVTEVGVTPLVLDVPVTATLGAGQSAYYRLQVPAGLDLAVTLHQETTFAWGEIYVAFERIPALSDFDVAGASPFENDQRALVPSTRAGTYYIMVLARSVAGGSAAFDVEARGLPLSVLEIAPPAGGTDGLVTTVVSGAGFQEGVEMLLRDGAGNLVAAESVERLSNSEARVRWNLAGVPIGSYDVVARTPDQRTGSLAGGFAVEAQRPLRIGYERSVPGALRSGASGAYVFQFGNISNVDAPVVLVFLKTRRGLALDISSPRFKTMAEILGLTPGGALQGFDAGGWRIYPLIARDVGVAEVARVVAIARDVGQPFPMQVEAYAMSEEVFAGLQITNLEQLRLKILNHPTGVDPSLVLLAQDPAQFRSRLIQDYVRLGLLRPGVAERVLTSPVPRAAEEYGAYLMCTEAIETLQCGLSIAECVPEVGLILVSALIPALAPYAIGYGAISCIWGLTTSCVYPSLGLELQEGTVFHDVVNVVDLGMSLSPGGLVNWTISNTKDLLCQRIAVSRDPNDILGPAGAGGERWVPVSAPLPYTIRFENDSTVATAAARAVVIRQRLDERLDPRTFRLGAFALGSSVTALPGDRAYFTGRLDLRDSLGVFVDVSAGIDVATREAFWILRAIDPATGQPPENPAVGVVPVNDALHRGEGFVTYTIRAAATARTGDVVRAEATIVFDDNDPIDTPPYENRLDAEAPQSHVVPLPPVVGTSRFTVSWTGTDDPGGSGLGTYDVFVRAESEPYRLWKGATTDTAADFEGVTGATYSFYSVATDRAGMTEAPPEVPDATVRVNDATPALGSLVSVDLDPEWVRLTWYLGTGVQGDVAVQRQVDGGGWERRSSLEIDGHGVARHEDVDVVSGQVIRYRVAVTLGGSQRHLGETEVVIPAPPLALYGALPNPAVGELRVSFSLPGRGEATLELFDVSGRRVASHAIGNLGPGRHVLELDERHRLPPGLYSVRLTRGGEQLVRKVAYLR